MISEEVKASIIKRFREEFVQHDEGCESAYWKCNCLLPTRITWHRLESFILEAVAEAEKRGEIEIEKAISKEGIRCKDHHSRLVCLHCLSENIRESNYED